MKNLLSVIIATTLAAVICILLLICRQIDSPENEAWNCTE